ncbi:MAG: glycosyltransferase family 4 protein [Burkholderiaceae bacterium]
MKIGYFTNQYPKVSHSFIRREILAVERQGLSVERYALRGWDAELADVEDLAERTRTRYLLGDGIGPLLRAALSACIRQPAAFSRAVVAALRQWRCGDRSLPHNLITLAEACLLGEWLRRDGIEHLHVHFATNGAQVARLTRLLGGPSYSMTVHGPEEWDAPRALGLFDKVRQSTFSVAISSFTRSQLCRWAHRDDWDKIAVVHCGLDASFQGASPAPVPDNRRLVCVGRLCAEKAQVLLVEAVAQLARRGVAIELVLAGDGDMRPQIEASIAAHGLGDRVRITGWLSGEQVRAELLAARAMVLPSFNEGLPVVIMEAMALMRPVISTYVAGIPELVRDGREGWLVPAGSVDALARAIERCLDTPVDVLRRMGAQGRERVLGRHSVDEGARRIAGLIRVARA